MLAGMHEGFVFFSVILIVSNFLLLMQDEGESNSFFVKSGLFKLKCDLLLNEQIQTI